MIDIFRAKRELMTLLSSQKNVVGVAVGYATRANRLTPEPAILVFVKKKLPLPLDVDARIPVTFHSHRVDVVEYAASEACCGRGS